MAKQERKSLLLVDDDASLLVTLGDFLKFEGYDVVTAESGETALEKLKKLDPALIILDMSMPGMGGVGFLKAVSTADGKPRYPILVLTARANMAEFFANVDVDGFVTKPCEPKDLLGEINRIIFLRSHATQSASGGGGRRVLLAEEEPLVREGLEHALSEAGFIVSSVEHGSDVLEKAVLDPPDVIVLKLIFENMNGDTVAGLLKTMPKTASVPVVLYDRTSSMTIGKYRVSTNAIDRFVSSDSPGAIISAIKEVLGKD